MKTTHTPGPWKFNGNNDAGKNKHNEFLVISERECIAKLPNRSTGSIVLTPVNEAEANAYLIAAAPSMFEQLTLLIDSIENGDTNEISQQAIFAARLIYNILNP